MEDNETLLNNMVADMKKQQGIHQASGYWLRHTGLIQKAIQRHGLKDFRRRNDISKSYGDPPQCYDPIDLLPAYSIQAILLRILRRIPPVRFLYKKFYKINKTHLLELNRLKNIAAHAQFRVIEEKLLPANRWPETLAGNPNNLFTVNGKEIGHANARSLVEIQEFSQCIDYSAVRVGMEIGGGIGAYTHMLIHCFPNIKKFIYLDIPPVLYVSTQYLRHYFGKAVIDYNQTRDLDKICFQDNDELEILCIAPWQLPRVAAPVDYFWNSASFQEMPADIVGNYAHEISRLRNPATSSIALYIYERHDGNTLSYEQIVSLFQAKGINLTHLPDASTCNIIQPGRRYISSAS